MVGHLKLARDKDLPEEWMVNLKMDWTVFNELKKTVDLKYNRKSPVPDPVARLKLVLRYLATGQGFKESTEQMFMDTMKEIFKATSSLSLVRIS